MLNGLKSANKTSFSSEGGRFLDWLHSFKGAFPHSTYPEIADSKAQKGLYKVTDGLFALHGTKNFEGIGQELF